MGEPGHKVVKVVLIVPAPYMGEVVAELVPTACGGNHMGIVVVVNSAAGICEFLREENFFHEGCLLFIRGDGGIALSACDAYFLIFHTSAPST